MIFRQNLLILSQNLIFFNENYNCMDSFGKNLGWWRGYWVLVGNDLFLVYNDSMHNNLHWRVVRTACMCKKVTHGGNDVHAVDAVNIGGGDPMQ